MKNKKMTGKIQHGFTKVESCLNNLIALYDETTISVDEEKAVDSVYHDFSKCFNTMCPVINSLINQ